MERGEGLLRFWLVVSGHPRLFKHSQNFGRHSVSLLLAIHYYGNGVEIVLKASFGSILGVRNLVSNMGYEGIFELKTFHDICAS